MLASKGIGKVLPRHASRVVSHGERFMLTLASEVELKVYDQIVRQLLIIRKLCVGQR